MFYVLRILRFIHKVVDLVEEGKPFSVKDKISIVNLELDATEVHTSDSSDIVIGHTELNKLSGILLDNVMDVLTGQEISQDIVIVMPTNNEVDPPEANFLNLHIQVNL